MGTTATTMLWLLQIVSSLIALRLISSTSSVQAFSSSRSTSSSCSCFSSHQRSSASATRRASPRTTVAATAKTKARTALYLSSSNANNDLFPLRRGSSVALVTPFDPTTGKLDMVGLERLLNYHVDAGTQNLCILGTTGEASMLNMNERKTVLEKAVKLVKGKMSILAGCGTINPNSVREMTLQAMDLGCDASLVVTPYYVKPPQRGLVKHMTTAADLGLPVIMYNVPGRTGVNFADEFMAIAAEHPNIVGIKDATGDLSRLHKMRELVKDKDPSFLLYSGDDSTSLDFIIQGGDGCISVTANVAAREMAKMVDLALAGKTDEARAINDRLDGLHKNLFLEANPIPVKWGAYRIGLIDSPYCRPPLDAFDDKTFGAQLEEALSQAGLL